MGMFVDLIYKLILPRMKAQGLDPDSVVKTIKPHKDKIEEIEDELKQLFRNGEIKDKRGKVLKYEDVFDD